ncbi:MAG TPA: cupin domain-containing protein [Candidatus Limiplasma sp.]|nr:cupin domain-containing protein [Candidatus Limiplasma sp.]
MKNPNPSIPGSRKLNRIKAKLVYSNETGCLHWYYPLSAIDDLGMFCYIEKKRVTDKTHPWAIQSHPFVNLYMYIIKGEGELHLGLNDGVFAQETYPFGCEDMLVVPRSIPYRLTGEWEAICFHARTNVYGQTVGDGIFSSPVLMHNKPYRPTTAETKALFDPGTFLYMNPTYSTGMRIPYNPAFVIPADLSAMRPEFGGIPHTDANDLYRDCPRAEQTLDETVAQEMLKNPMILGARVMHKSDAEYKYNEADQNEHYAYPLSWADDIGIFIPARHNVKADADKPASSHCHPDIQEFKFVLDGRGKTALGHGDPSFNTEWIEFEKHDLIITPRDVPHFDAGDYTAIFFHTRNTAFGVPSGSADCPHKAITYVKPEDAVDGVIGPSRMLRMNARETYAQVLARPVYERLSKDEF